MTNDLLMFENREAFRAWLAQNVDAPGVWLEFHKKGAKTVTAAQALEEALCFGWIDGQMESIDDARYRKYFAPRRPQSKWSEKNRKLAEKLESEGRMTEHGRKKIEDAKKRGAYESEPRAAITDEQIAALEDALTGHDKALANFKGMTRSVRRTYTGAYFSAKTEEGRARKLAQLVERLTLGLDPMASLAKAKEALERAE